MKTWEIVFWAITIPCIMIGALLGLRYLISISPDATVEYYLVRSDTAYTYTETRGNGMTIINYYDMGVKK